MPDIKDIIKAQERIHTFIYKTPVLKSSLLNEWCGHEVFFKAECLQKIGAFKARGACNAISWLIENNSKPKRIIANSSGNHAQAVAWAARQFGVPSTIYMPVYASKVKVQATRSYGAQVELSENRIITDEKVKEASKEEGAYWIPPFNHDQVISGQGTAIVEALHEITDVDAVFAPCGGGGLLSGTVIATHALSPGTKVFGAEPFNANDAAQSLKMNSIQRLQSVPDTIADGAMTMAVGDITFQYLKMLDGLFEIEESKIIYWTQWLTHLLKLHIEPTSAMAMEAGFQWLKNQKTKRRIIVILSGGNIDQETSLKIWSTNHLDVQPKI
ncbi:MAG TPA: serine/threonine dehydratase [Bacteroidales bacterium]